MSKIRAEALELFGTTLDWLADDFVIVYLDDSYAFSTAHDRLSDIGFGSVLYAPTLAGKDATDGVLTAADPAPFAFAPGTTIRGAWLYHDSGVAATSELLVWYNRSSDGALIVSNAALNPTSGAAVRLTLPGLPYGLLKL